jgi:hypothetical protein
MQIYKNLIRLDGLTNENLRKYSPSEKNFLKSQEKAETVFAKYKNNPNITFVEISDLLFDDGVCLLGTKDESYFADFRHLSFAGLKKVEARLSEFIDEQKTLSGRERR